MSIRVKAFAIVTAATAAVTLALFGISQVVLSGGFDQIEDQDARRNVLRALSAISHDIDTIDTNVGDWASWDDTYEFAIDESPEYAESNLTDTALEGLGLDVFFITGPDGRPLFQGAIDHDSGEPASFPAGIFAALGIGPVSAGDDPEQLVRSGIVTLPNGPLLFAVRPVLTSQDVGPPRGQLLMGRYLDASETAALGAQTLLKLHIIPIDAAREAALTADGPVSIQTVNKNVIAGYGVIPDVSGTPQWAVRVDIPRDIRNNAETVTFWTLGSIAGGGLLLALVIAALIDRIVVRRIVDVGHEVSAVTATNDLGTRLTTGGSDEVGRLATGINQMLASIEASEQRYARLVAEAGDGIIVVHEGAIVFANAAMARIAGRPSAHDLIGASFGALVVPDDRVRLTPILSSVAAGRASHPIQVRLAPATSSPPGEFRTVEVVATSFAGPGEPGIHMVVRDVTPRIEDEARQRGLDERLRDVQRFESLALMAGGMAHDFNNLLMTVIGNVVLMRMAIDDPAQIETLDRIDDAARRAAELTGQLRVFTGTGLVDTSNARLSEVVTEIAALLQSTVSQTASLRLEVDDRLPEVSVDATQLRQVIVNLLTNSAEALDGRWGRITLRAGGAHFDEPSLPAAGAITPGSYAFIEVEDDGPGIPDEIRSRIFDPFFSTRGQGRGLGLAVVAGIIRAHGGAIVLESQPGKGSRIRVLFPARPLASPTQAEPRPAEVAAP